MIIGISGKKQHGKDTVAKIIQDLTSPVSSGYVEVKDGMLSPMKGPSRFIIKKFADKLKQIVAFLIGCSVTQLEDNNFKETPLGEEWRVWYWVHKGDSGSEKVSGKIYSSKEEALYRHLAASSIYLVEEVLTPRKLLQLMGTECGREIIHPNIWVNALMNDYKTTDKIIKEDGEVVTVERTGIADFTESGYIIPAYSTYPKEFHNKVIPDKLFKWYELIERSKVRMPDWIITDVRFPNEVKAIEDRGGIVIRVNRDSIKSNDEHPSETALDHYPFKYLIRNNYDLPLLEGQVYLMLKHYKII
jgi:hypothetical protein